MSAPKYPPSFHIELNKKISWVMQPVQGTGVIQVHVDVAEIK